MTNPVINKTDNKNYEYPQKNKTACVKQAVKSTIGWGVNGNNTRAGGKYRPLFIYRLPCLPRFHGFLRRVQ